LRVVEAVEPDATVTMEREGFGPIVQEEVRHLPEKYRGVVVLCYWEGLTQERAAVQLGIPLGTVRSRLARAREILRRRLTRRGLAPLGGAIDARLDGASASLPRLAAVPADLIQATIRAAADFAAGPLANSAVSVAVASIVQRVIWSMTMIRISSIMAGVVVLGLAGYGVKVAGQQARTVPARSGPESLDQTTIQGGPVQEPPAHGTKPARPDARRKSGPFEGIYSNVKGQTAIMRIVPDGSVVRKGDFLCQLDSAALQNELINQRITTRSAEANFQNAKLTRERAEWEARWFRDELCPREQREIEGEIRLAESELAVGEEEVRLAKSADANNPLAAKRADLTIARAKLALEKSKNRLHILTHYTKDHRYKELSLEVEKTKSNELSKEATWELEKGKEVKLEKQIAACTITAPIDGTVVYVDFIRQDAATGNQPRIVHIERGASVRERQLILQIVPPPTAAPDSR
jgi:hypothetical protein